MIVVHLCARCGHPMRMRNCYQGKTVRCPGCAAVETVPKALPAEAAVAGSDPCVRRKVRALPCGCAGADAKAGNRRPSGRLVLPWMLLAPAIAALGLLMWAGHGVLWAALGVGLGSLCLLVAQHARWRLSLRVGPSLSLALVGHGLTLAGPLMSSPSLHPILAAEQSADAPASPPLNLQSQPNPPPVAMTSLGSEARFRNSNQTSPADLAAVPVHLGALLAVAVYADSAGEGSLFVTTADRSLKQFSYPEFELRGACRIEQPAYRAAMDQQRGLLWVAVSDPRDLRVNEHGDRPEGRGDLHVYDLHASRRDNRTGDSRLRPRQVLALQGAILELFASPDPRWLFYLARTADGVHLGRIDADKRCIDARLPLPNETRALCGTADGLTLYAAGGRNVFVVDPASLRPRRRQEINADIHAVAADNDGQVYLAEAGQWTCLTRLDLSGSEPTIQQWDPRMHGRVYLRMAPDQNRFYVGTSSVIANRLDSLLLRGHESDTPPQVGIAVADSHGPVRGEFFLTPDGQYLLNRWGRVFRLAQGKMLMPHFGTATEKH
jgi:hypothetical protein